MAARVARRRRATPAISLPGATWFLRRRRFTSDASSAALCGCLEFGLITPRAMQLCVRSFLHDTSGDLWRSASIPAASRAPDWHPLRIWTAGLKAELFILFAHRTPLARSEDSSGSAGRRISIHAVDCTGLLPCCGTRAERRRPTLATASNYAFIVLRVANDAAERCKQLAFCSGSIPSAVAFILRVSPTPRSGASYNICSGKPAAECSLHAAGCQRCASPS